MGNRLDRHLAAICHPRTGLIDNLAVNTGAALASSYSEANPRPGLAVANDELSRLVPVISGGQSEDITLDVLAGGDPVLATDGQAAEIGYRFENETADQHRGWISPTWLTGWESIKWHASAVYTQPQCVTIPTSQAVLVTWQVGATNICRRWDPTDWTLGDETIIVDTDGLCAPVVLPTDRVLVLTGTDVYRSDDEGVTWTAHSRDVFGSLDVGGQFEAHLAAGADGQILALLDDGVGNVTQCASDDALASAQHVETAVLGTNVRCVALPSGGFLVLYIRSGDSIPCVRRLSSAWELIGSALEIEVMQVGRAQAAIAVEPDGLLWMLASIGPNLSDDLYAYVSADSGATWQLCQQGVMHVSATADDYLRTLHMTSAGGHVLLTHQVVASTATGDYSIGMAILGGWSNVTNGVAEGARDGLIGRSGSGVGRTWIPYELPGFTGLFTASGAGLQTVASGQLVIQTVAATRYYTQPTGTDLVHAAMWQCRLTAGAGPDQRNVTVFLRCSNAVDQDYNIEIRMAPGQFKIRDVHGAVDVASVSVLLSSEMQFAVQMAAETAGVWYRRPGSTTWLEAWRGTLTTNPGVPVANGLVMWGHPANGSAQSVWRFFHDGPNQWFGVGLGLFPEGFLDQPRRLHYASGRPLSQIPVPLGTDTGGAWISALGGAAALGETYGVEAAHDYPIEHIFPDVSPSPAERWRSADKSEQIIALDFEGATHLGDSLALAAIGCNFRTAYLEHSTGGAWTTAATLDLATGFVGLNYALAGDTLTPAGTSGTRWLQANEAAGGYAVVETGAGTGTAARRIVGHTAGKWAGLITLVEPRIILDADGTEDAAGDCDIVWPSGVLVVHFNTLTARRYWRLRIPADQVTPDAYYEAGILSLMRINVLGRAPDWGWSQEHAPNSETARSRRGTTRVRELGPPLTTWTWAWTTGAFYTDLRQSAAPDYLGSSVGLPLAGQDDIAWILRAIQEETGSGSVPVLALSVVPDASGTTLTDRTLWHYGRMVSSVRVENVSGTEGSNEFSRIAQVSIEGIG